MRRPHLLLLAVFAPLCLVWAQEPQPPAAPPASSHPAQVAASARIQYVARALHLRDDQVKAIMPLLVQAQERLARRQQTLDALWGQGQTALATADEALIIGRQLNRTTQRVLDRVIAGHDEALNASDLDLEAIGAQIMALLDRNQLARLQTLAQARALDRSIEQSRVGGDIAGYIRRHAVAMRQLSAEEYGVLRVPIALRLAQELVAPNQPRYNNAVTAVLRVLDSIRQASDAQLADAGPALTVNIARGLGLPPPAAGDSHPVSWDDFMFFVSHEQTVEQLRQYRAEPAMEVAP